jgi:glycosyltransferase involved in cell wall biosynthesis
MHIVHVQYGDYGDTVERFADGGKETYYAQRYTVEFIAGLTRTAQVTVVTFSKTYPERVLHNGVRVVGQQLYGGDRLAHAKLVRLVRRLAPTHLILGGPLLPLLWWASTRRDLRVLPLFADTFRAKSLKAHLMATLLGRALNAPSIEVVSNHSLAASLDLCRIGVDPSKVVPFDWPALASPRDRPPKRFPANPRFRVIYVGSLIDTKGVGDVVAAIASLRRSGEDVEFSAVGKPNPIFERLAVELGVQDLVHWLGFRAHEEVIRLMADHDAVVVPSWHEYPEGLPMTIYEGLCSRSPVIASDHPAFSLRLRDGENAVLFRARDPEALAGAIMRLRNAPPLYERLSRDAERYADTYFCPLKWHELISKWLSNDPAEHRNLRDYALSGPHYQDVLRGDMFASQSFARGFVDVYLNSKPISRPAVR